MEFKYKDVGGDYTEFIPAYRVVIRGSNGQVYWIAPEDDGSISFRVDGRLVIRPGATNSIVIDEDFTAYEPPDDND